MTLYVFDLREIIEAYSPRTLSENQLYANQNLLEFLNRFTIHDVIEATMLIPPYQLDNESIIYEIIDHRFPEGTGLFGDDVEALQLFELLVSFVQISMDDLLQRKLSELGRSEAYQYIAFEAWRPYDVALFRDVRFD
jgi:hypothetical protein